MRVLLGLGDVQLALAVLGDHLGERGRGLVRREGDRIGPAVVVLGHRRHLEGPGAAAIEFVEVRLAERPGHLAGPVGAEVDEDERLVGLGAVVVADHHRLDELVGDVLLVRGLDRADGRLGSRRLRVHDRVVGLLRPVPAPVAVHAPVAASDGPDPAGAPQPALDLLDVSGAVVRQGVAPVRESVDHQVRDPLLAGQLDDRLDVLPAGVDPAVRDQPDRVQAPAPGLARRAAGVAQGLVLEEAAVGDRVVDARQVLLDDRAGAQVEVADLGVAHLAVGQADVPSRGGESRVRIGGPELVEVRRVRLRHGVAGAVGGQAEAVEDHERQGGHRHARRPGRERHQGAASTIAAKSSGSRLAPPTSAPSTSGRASSSAALPGFTEPP